MRGELNPSFGKSQMRFALKEYRKYIGPVLRVASLALEKSKDPYIQENSQKDER